MRRFEVSPYCCGELTAVFVWLRMLCSFCKYALAFDSRCKRYSFYVIIVFALFCSLYITSRSYGPSGLVSVETYPKAVDDDAAGYYGRPAFGAAATGSNDSSSYADADGDADGDADVDVNVDGSDGRDGRDGRDVRDGGEAAGTALRCVSFDDIVAGGQRLRFDVNRSDVLVFLHIQKTAGTTFERYLVRQLHLPQPCQCRPKRKRCTCLRPSGSGYWLFSRFSTGWNCGLHADWTELIASGCVDKFLNRREKRTVKRRYFVSTMLRDPVARFISEFKHVQRGATWQATPHFCNGRPPSLEEVPPCFDPELGWEGVSLEEFLNCSSNFAFNRMSRMLADLTTVGCYSRKLLDANSRNVFILESAKSNLRKMAFFGLQEDMRKSQYLFEELFNLRFNKPMVNQLEQSDPSEFSATQLQRIRDVNQLDIEIYDFARKLFYERFQLLKTKDNLSGGGRYVTVRTMMNTVARDTLPVFVFPTQLNIFLQDRESSRQLLTIYNPYTFIVEYRILCTDPANYSVQEAYGRLKPQSFADVVVRRLASAPGVPSSKQEKLRVQIKKLGKPYSAGYCDVLINVEDHCLVEGSPESRRSTAVFHDVQNVPADRMMTSVSSAGASGIPLWSIIVIASVCVLCLSAPHYDQPSPSVSSQLWPKWLWFSFSQKLVASYVLGIVTAIFLKS